MITKEVLIPENSSKGPWYANSNTASSSLFVIIELAIKKFLLSIAPLNGRPTWYKLSLPKSWKVVFMPGLNTLKLLSVQSLFFFHHWDLFPL